MVRLPKGSSQFANISEDDMTKMVSDVVFYILSHERRRIPSRKADIFKTCNLSGKTNEVKDRVFELASLKILHVFGLEWTELPGDKKGLYILINKIQENPHVMLNKNETAQLGLLYTILALIFMSNDVIRDDVLFHFLKILGLVDSDSDSFETQSKKDFKKPFGNVRDLIVKEWGSKQHYISVKSLDGNKGTLEYRWGERAVLEVKKSKLLEIICQMYDCEPSSFKEQYDKVIQEEGENVFKV